MEENKEETKKFISCSECNQECCRSVIVEVDEPETEEDWEDVKWQVAHKNVRVLKDNDDDWCIEFLTDCDQLDEKGACKIYNKRPTMCRNHDPETCVINGEGDYYKIVFDCIEDVEKYLAENPEAVHDEMVNVHTCPKCNHEFTDDEEEGDEDSEEDEN